MVLGDTPHSSSAESLDEENLGMEDEESVESFSSNLSALGQTVDPTLVHHLSLEATLCRVTHSGEGEDGDYICCKGGRCRTKGHADARKAGARAPPGYYIAKVSPSGLVLGATTDGRLTRMDLQLAADAARARDQMLIDDALDRQNESVTFEDVIYDTAKEFPVEAQLVGEVNPNELPTPTARGGLKTEDGKPTDVQAMDVLTAMAEQMRQMNLTNQTLLTTMLQASQNINPPSTASTPTSTAATVGPSRPKRYHAVAVGRIPGIYEDKNEVYKQVQGVPFASWQSFKTREGAQNHLNAFQVANQIRDRQAYDAATQAAPKRAGKPTSILKSPSTSQSTSSTARPRSTSQVMTCTICHGDHLDQDCPHYIAVATPGVKDPPAQTYYAVAIGRNPGIYLDWGGCFKQVNGYSGNLYLSCASFEEASLFVQNNKAEVPGPNGIPQESLKGNGLTLNAPSYTGGAVEVQGADTSTSTSTITKKVQGRALGRDPSTGKESELFKIAVRSEGLLIDAMTPENLSPQARQALTDATVDAVAQPGAFRVTDNDDQTNTLTLSVATLANGSGGSPGRLRNVTDYLWKQERRTTMRYGIDSMEKLKTRITDLEDVGERVINHLNMVTRDILVQEGWTEEEANDWATSSLVFRISSDTIRNYIDLHQRIYSVGQADGWPMAKAEMEHHASKLAIRRSSSPSRILCLCELYCYLRDAKKSSWRTLQLMEARERAMLKKVDESLARMVTPGTSSGAAVCKKCHSLLHPGGQAQCPFKNLSNTKASEAMTKLMSALYKMASDE
jgi:viroplasmin and RNaseH domain-containing protein